jgi:hypothetical protein
MLRAETFTLFADERQPYWAVYHLKGREPQVSAPVPAAVPSRPPRPGTPR